MKRLLAFVFLMSVLVLATDVKLAANDAAKNDPTFQNVLPVYVRVHAGGLVVVGSQTISTNLVETAVMINRGENVTLLVYTEECYSIQSITMNGDDITSDFSGSGSGRSLTLPNVTDTLHFEFTFTAATYTLQTQVTGNGRIQVTSPAGTGGQNATTIACRTQLIYDAIPDAGYKLASTGVRVGTTLKPVTNTPTGSNTHIVLGSDITDNVFITATFIADTATTKYTITPSVRGGGTISPNDQELVDSGSSGSITYTFTPTAGTCWKVDSIVVDGVSEPWTASSYTFTYTNITSNRTLTVVFRDTCSGIGSTYLTDFAIFPNPTDGKLSFKSDTEITKIEVLNLNGIVEMVIENPDYSLDLSRLGNGLYFLRVYSAAGVEYRNIILTR